MHRLLQTVPLLPLSLAFTLLLLYVKAPLLRSLLAIVCSDALLKAVPMAQGKCPLFYYKSSSISSTTIKIGGSSCTSSSCSMSNSIPSCASGAVAIAAEVVRLLLLLLLFKPNKENYIP
ncbi:hypothetical protein G6F56_013344 [Rhizopus delemar]|nr:hypothetical protein G6F56_013344 [Rhizopus delemar]